jgi:hypothetical protein
MPVADPLSFASRNAPTVASNEFFYQFPNCLPYENLDDCVKQIKRALRSEPTPLDEECIMKLSWEGATERMYEASGISVKDALRHKESGMDKEDRKAAEFHVDAARKSLFVRTLFGGKQLFPKKKQESL